MPKCRTEQRKVKNYNQIFIKGPPMGTSAQYLCWNRLSLMSLGLLKLGFSQRLVKKDELKLFALNFILY